MARNRKKDAATRAAELREQAKEVAGHSGEALKDFAESTGKAAKEFANSARDAAKELVEAIEKAGKKVEPEPKRRGRRFLRTTLIVGAGVAIFANDRARNVISQALRRARGETEQPAVWRPEPQTTSGNGDVRETATQP